MTKTIYGKVHGKTIELDEDLGVAEGQKVEVQVKLIPPAKKWGEGILRSAGGWADYPEMDAIMETIYHHNTEDRPFFSITRLVVGIAVGCSSGSG